ncbi:MAG TPA: response regulator transcription factor [Anaerolineales bacterium]|nr:response regulator transcription factor [Anaerolineales bacterium]
MRASNILIIEDDEIVARTIERCLRGKEFHVNVANSGVAGLRAAHRKVPDLVILDVIMPGMDGFTVCKEMREDPILKEVPILFLTAKIKPEDAIVGLSLGADDYLRKPFNVDELLLRVIAILRRTKNNTPPALQSETAVLASSEQKTIPINSSGENHVVQIGKYSLNTRTFIFTSPVKGEFRVTPVQYALLYHLMSHPNKIFSPSLLLEEVWDYPDTAGSADLVRVHIKNLREAIEEDPKEPVFIKTIKGYGYTIQTDESEEKTPKARKTRAK